MVDQIFVFALDAKSDLDVLQSGSFLEHGSIHVEEFTLHHFTLIRHENKLSSIFQLTSETLQSFDNLVITGSGLSRLSGLAASKTDVRISIISLLMSLELKRRMQRLVAGLLASVSPVLINGLGVLQNMR